MDLESQDCLYNLLPAVYRIRDAEKGYPLRALLRIITRQVKIVKEDIDSLWDNFFIETCDDWIIPYIGDLVGNNPLQYTGRSNRPDVAKTIYYRRRKGTLPMLEELAHDITNWGCHAVEFFQLLDWTQNLNHIKYDIKGCAEVRDLTTMDLVDTPFDIVTHTVDIRSINQTQGLYNIRNIGFYLWRLNVLPLKRVESVLVTPKDPNNPNRYHFNTLGQPIPLFTKPSFKSGIRTPENKLPGPIRQLGFKFNKDLYYGQEPGMSVSVYVDDKRVDINHVIFQDLCAWEEVNAVEKEGVLKGRLAIDPRLGRFAFSNMGELTVIDENDEEFIIDLATLGGRKISADYNTAFSGFLGAGTYERSAILKTEGDVLVSGHEPALFIRVSKYIKDIGIEGTIQEAINTWKASEQSTRDAIIQIEDSATYFENINIELPCHDSKLIIQAANRQRPTLILDAGSNFTIKGTSEGASGGVILNGLLITRNPEIHIGEGVVNLEIYHCTLDPGGGLDSDGISLRPMHQSLVSSNTLSLNPNLKVLIDHSIVGGINLSNKINELTILDSIVDARDGSAIAFEVVETELGGPPARIERATILGVCKLKGLLLASEVLFVDKVEVQKKQEGCVRFSYVPKDSEMPRQYECIYEDPPKSSLEDFAEKPVFTSTNFGDPGYCQLSLNCNKKIRTGAENGSEMGAFCSLNNHINIQNLKMKLEEYMPFGLKPGFIFIT